MIINIYTYLYFKLLGKSVEHHIALIINFQISEENPCGSQIEI